MNEPRNVSHRVGARLHPAGYLCRQGAAGSDVTLDRAPSDHSHTGNQVGCEHRIGEQDGPHSPSVLVGCEYSATVRDAFRSRGFDAWSNDILPTQGEPLWHITGCVRDAIRSRRWSLIILHVPCTAMAVCGNRHYGVGTPGHDDRREAVKWTLETWNLAKSHSGHVALENPASVIFPVLRDEGAAVQYVQPYEFGHLEQKKTGLALHNLPRLNPTNDVYEAMMQLPKRERERIFHMAPSEDRGLLRSKFYTGFAEAMADQWGGYLHSLNDSGSKGTDCPRFAVSDDLLFHDIDNTPGAQHHHA